MSRVDGSACTDGEKRAAARSLVLVFAAVVLATSPWFAGAAVVPELTRVWELGSSGQAWLTISVNLGFIAGTLFYALSNLADVFDMRRVFAVSALTGALLNLGFAWGAHDLATALVFRFLTGATLAGVYPVGMKIVASWYRDGLGWRLGVLVGAVTFGSASPYLIRVFSLGVAWPLLVSVSSLSSALGALLVLRFLCEGPHLRARAPFDWRMTGRVFRSPGYRLASFGYYGHMWELYAFWSLLPKYLAQHPSYAPNTPHLTWSVFAIMAMGGVACIAFGLLSRRLGERRVAAIALCGSACCCTLSPWLVELPPGAFLACLLVWGMLVVADSPQFSALVTRHAPREYVGTALTVQNGVGFAITVCAMQIVSVLGETYGWRLAFAWLAPGPFLGLAAMIVLARYENGRTPP